MYSWKTALVTLTIFGLGGVAGSLITAEVIKTKIEHVETTAVAPVVLEEGYPARMVRIMEVQVKLSPGQVERVKEILRHAQKELLRLNGEWQQKLAELEPGSQELIAARNERQIKSRRVFGQSDERVRELLTKEQHPLFEEFVRRRRLLNQQNRPFGGLLPRPGEERPAGALD